MSQNYNSCMFCAKSKDEIHLIDMNKNSVILDNESIVEFSDLIKDLLDLKIARDIIPLACEECKNVLIQFHIFKQSALSNPGLTKNEANHNVCKVKLFLDETESEKVFCIRYNKCLSLVPESKISFMEIFKQWQPHVILDVINEPRKRPKFKEDLSSFNKETEEVNQAAISMIDDVQEETLECVEENLEGISEEEWLQMEIANSEVTEENTKVWDCLHCVPLERFTDENEFRNHLLTVHLNYEHTIFEENDEPIAEEQEISSQDEIMIQETFDESVKRKLDVMDNLDCSQCDFSTVTRSEFKIHQKTHIDHKNFQSSRFERLFCTSCSYQFISQAHFQAHVNGHQLYEIVSKHSTYPICEICNVMFCEDSFANSHQEKHELGLPIVEVIPSKGSFLKFGHHRADLELPEPDLIDDDVLKCGHCSKKFYDEGSCRLHQLIFHTKTLMCPIESRVFNGNQAFSIHMKNNHPELFGDDVKFRCSVCKSKFDTLYEKLRHMKTCDKKKFQCHHCDKKFSQKCYLNTHLRQVNGESSITCEVCGKVCANKGDYQIHNRSHSNVKPFKCSICPKAYKTSSARAAHLDTHLDKGFNCTFCKGKFTSRRTLQKHVKTKHQRDLEDMRIKSNDLEDLIIEAEVVNMY